MANLATELFREVRPDFFRVLASTNAPIYVDVLDALAAAAESAPAGLDRDTALAIVAEVLANHPDFAPEEDFPGEALRDSGGPTDLSAQILRKLTDTRWLSEPPRSDYRRVLHFDSSGEILLDALRQIARGELPQFTDKLSLVCSTLANPASFTEQPLADLEACLANAQVGLRELRSMQKTIERHTRRLQGIETLKQSFEMLYDKFSAEVGHACYRELVRAQLPTRLLHARQRLDGLINNEPVLAEMQRELLRRHSDWDVARAASEVRLKLDDLDRLLESVGPQAEGIDHRAAEFARRAYARFRYLQEIGRGQRDRVQFLFEFINRQSMGQKLSDLETDFDLPALAVPDVELLCAESLYTPRLRRALSEIELMGDELSDAQRDAALVEMESSLRDALNVIRANRFVARLTGKRGTSVPLAELPVLNDDDVADVVACLLHNGARDAAYSVNVPRVTADADAPEFERKAGYAIERFVLTKK